MKQETLEEAADNWVRKPVIGTRRESFIEGAKWQAERMHSEENGNHLEWIYNRLIGFHNENPNYDYMIKLKTIIDQFKKK
jgi:hypothetical protein